MSGKSKSAPVVTLPLGGLSSLAMSAAFRFDPVELPPEYEALRREVREFIAGELAAGLWVPNSDFDSHRSAAFSRRLGARGWIGMTWPKRYGGGEPICSNAMS